MSGSKTPGDARKEEEYARHLESDLADVLGVDVAVSLVQVTEHGRQVDLAFEVRPEAEALAERLREYDGDRYGDVVAGDRGRIVHRVEPEETEQNGDSADSADSADRRD
jgi:hypothetical protein